MKSLRLAILWLALASLLSSLPAAAGNCGAENQRPCKVFERIPSCDGNLIERGGKCIAAGAPICGKKDQRPCKAWERFPSCDPGLVEDFTLNKCKRKLTEAQVLQKISSSARLFLSQNPGVTAYMERVLQKVSSGPAHAFLTSSRFRDMLLRGQVDQVVAQLRQYGLSEYSFTPPDGTPANFNEVPFQIRTITFGTSASATAFVGARGSVGLAFDLSGNGRHRVFWNAAYQGGVALGGAANLTLGFWTFDSTAMCRHGSYAQVSFKLGIGFVGGAAMPVLEEWAFYNGNPPFSGFFAGVGSGTQLALVVGRGLTFTTDLDGNFSCNSCGGHRERPCMFFEHIPSCEPNLYEKYGRCLGKSDEPADLAKAMEREHASGGH